MRITLKPPFSVSLTSETKPSAFRMRAIDSFRRECGTSVRAWRACTALRMRVSRSAIGSFIPSSPRRLGHPGDEPLERQVAETDAAHLEAPHVRARPAAPLAAVAEPDREFQRLADRRLPRLGRHRPFPQSLRNGMPSAIR